MKLLSMLFALTTFPLLAQGIDRSATGGLQTKAIEGGAIAVTGTGTLSASPDMARVFLRVQTENADPAEAVNLNNRLMGQVMEAMLGLGVAQEDLATTNFNFYTRQNHDSQGRPTTVSYNVSNNLTVTLRQLDSLGELLAQAVAQGASSINGIYFDTSDREDLYQRALEAAVANAHARALVLAQARSVTLGEVLSISTGGFGGGNITRAGDESFSSSVTSVPVTPGDLNISVSVSVVYQIQ